MRTFKSIERPAQVLGIDLQSLGLVFALPIGGFILVGILGLFLPIPAWVFLLLVALAIGLYFLLKYLNKHRPPGFLVGYLSYHLQQPKRLTIGIRHDKKQRT